MADPTITGRHISTFMANEGNMTPAAKIRRREKREQKLIEHRSVITALISAGKSCANCQHFGRAPIGMKDRICELDSDSGGYLVVKPDHVCLQHERS